MNCQGALLLATVDQYEEPKEQHPERTVNYSPLITSAEGYGSVLLGQQKQGKEAKIILLPGDKWKIGQRILHSESYSVTGAVCERCVGHLLL